MQRYELKSDFLKAVVAGDTPLSGKDVADANLQRLISSMRDEDVSNHDWATFLLAQGKADSIVIREALALAARDQNSAVRLPTE
jgi:hypothetical protein